MKFKVPYKEEKYEIELPDEKVKKFEEYFFKLSDRTVDLLFEESELEDKEITKEFLEEFLKDKLENDFLKDVEDYINSLTESESESENL